MIEDWTYLPEFVRDESGAIVRVAAEPRYRHTSGAIVDLRTSRCVSADMLDAEGKHAEAADTRAMLVGDNAALCRLLKCEMPAKCACGSGLYPWWQPTKAGQIRVCDRCMRPT